MPFHRFSWTFLLSLIAVSTTSPAMAEGLTLELEEDVIVIEGLTPETEAVLFGVGRGVAGFIPYELRVAERLAADASGTTRFELSQELPASSVWVVVALADGELTLASSPGDELREVAFPGRGLPASLRRLEDVRASLAVLWVRPMLEAGSDAQGGAWTGRVRDGSGLDGDGREDRRVSVLLDLLEPLDSSPAPEQLAPGDVLVGIDTETLEIYTYRLRG